MPRTINLSTTNLHTKIKNDLNNELTSAQNSSEVKRVFGKQRFAEGLIQSLLSKPSGPERALRVYYEDGSLKEFLNLLVEMERETSGDRDFRAMRDEKVSQLENLDNRDERYFVGNLRNKVGGGITTQLGRVILTAEGKNQLFLTGGGDLEVAFRNQMGKSFIEKVHKRFTDLQQNTMHYNKELAKDRALNAAHFHVQVETMLQDPSISKKSAHAVARNQTKPLYQGLLQPSGLKSATDAVLVARDKLPVDDALLCGQNRESEVSVGKDRLKQLRSTVKLPQNDGTRLLHSHLGDMRYRVCRLMQRDHNIQEATKIVVQQAKDNQTYVLRDAHGKIEPAEVFAKEYFDRDTNFEHFEMALAQMISEAGLDPAGAAFAAAGGRAMIAVAGDEGSSGRARPNALAIVTAMPPRHVDSDDESGTSSGSMDLSPPTQKKKRRQMDRGGSLDGGSSLRRSSISGRLPGLSMGVGAPFDDFTDLATASSSAPGSSGPGIRQRKAPKRQASGSGSLSGNAVGEPNEMDGQEEWTYWLMIEKGDWPRCPGFKDVAQYLASDAGTEWRSKKGIFKVASATELFEW